MSACHADGPSSIPSKHVKYHSHNRFEILGRRTSGTFFLPRFMCTLIFFCKTISNLKDFMVNEILYLFINLSFFFSSCRFISICFCSNNRHNFFSAIPANENSWSDLIGINYTNSRFNYVILINKRRIRIIVSKINLGPILKLNRILPVFLQGFASQL